VADHLGQYLQSPDRLAVEGKGAVEPIADNGTREGRALNRRVEIMIPREDTL
jgi:type VI secretion system protein ImpK